MGHVVVLGVAAVTTTVLTPLVRRLAVSLGAVVAPDPRRVHTRPTPTLGGVAMFGGVLAGLAAAAVVGSFDAVLAEPRPLVGVVLAAAVALVVGALDDLREVSPPAKAAGQVLAGSVLYLFGVTLIFFRIPFAGFVVLAPDLVPLVTVLWVMGMCNALNLIDGLDGLAAGIVAIAAGSFLLYGLRLSDIGLIGPDNPSPLLAAIAAGVSVGFLPHNMHPARIFMGDAGALMLGVLMAASTALVGGRTADPFSGQTFFFLAPLFIPFFILGIPILDTALSIVRRAAGRTGIASPDKNHLHHRLVDLGHGHRRAVLILWGWTALLCAFVLYPTYSGSGDALVPLGVAGLGLLLYTLFHPGVRAARRARADGGSPGPAGLRAAGGPVAPTSAPAERDG